MTTRAITEIPLEQLHDSPFNPPDRATLNIAELAASIKAEGRVHSPLLVRPCIGEEDGFEIVFGHRRRYAAEAAGLATVPCEVRAMSNAEARAAQAAENVQRENLKALEEAEQYQAMIDGDNLSANDVAARIGKSRSHVYGRLRLLSLCPQVRDALKSGEIQSEVALYVARVGDEKMQAAALQAIRAHNVDMKDGGTKSTRRIRELLNEKFSLDLGQAIFSITSAELVPSAGSCTDCRKRTGNAPEFDDVTAEKTSEECDQEEARLQAEISKLEKAGEGEKADALYEDMQALVERSYAADRLRHRGANVCTDPACFEAKKKAHLKAEATRLQAEGATVIAGGKARQAVNARGELAEGFIPADKVDLAKAKKDVKPVTIQNPRDGTTVQAYLAEDLQAAGVKVKAPKAKRPSGGYNAEHHERERLRRVQGAEAEGDARLAVFKAVRAAAHDQPRGEFDLGMVARAMVDRLPHDDLSVLLHLYAMGTIDVLRDAIETMEPADLGRLLLDCAMAEDVACDQWNYDRTQPAALLAAAAHYGVDIEAARASVQTPAPAEATPTKGKRGKKAEQPELV